MTKRQKWELEGYFMDGMPFYLAKELLGIENCEQEIDAAFTWRRWNVELQEWGFYSY